MNLIDWKKVYENAKKFNYDDFLASVQKMEKVDDLPIVQKFSTYMGRYESEIIPKLLENIPNITPAQFVFAACSEVKKNPKLQQAFQENPSSMFASILAAAEIGLVPSELHGEFFLIPRNIKQSNGHYKMTVTPLIGYKGIVKLLLRSGDIEALDAEVVYKGDKFKVSYGLNPNLEHSPKFTSTAVRTAENITHVYAVAHYKNSKPKFTVMTRDELLAVKNMNKYDNELYFNDKNNPNRWLERKTCLIQLSKLLNKDLYGTKAIEMENKISNGAILTLENDNQIKIIEGTPVKPTRFRNIYGTLNSIEK
jgi:phage RecT family recombinase